VSHSKTDLESELQLPRGRRVIEEGRGGLMEIGVIHRVVHFRAELRMDSFRDLDIPEQRPGISGVGMPIAPEYPEPAAVDPVEDPVFAVLLVMERFFSSWKSEIELEPELDSPGIACRGRNQPGVRSQPPPDCLPWIPVRTLPPFR
jgi:hypothetical protein